MEESIVDIKLLNYPTILDCNIEKSSYCDHFGHWCKCFSVTHLLPMGVLSGGSRTRIYVLFFSRASNSNFIASTHFGCLDACMCLVLVDFLCNGGCGGGVSVCRVGVGIASAESVGEIGWSWWSYWVVEGVFGIGVVV
ncbi:hypothetical protein Tco_0714929 [Tanacetum coccineum]